MKTIAVADATHRQLVARKNDEGLPNLDAVVRELLGSPRPSETLRRSMAAVGRVARLHGLSRIRLFGSAGRGMDVPGSDLDLLVDFRGPHDLLDVVSLRDDLSEALGCPVDATTEGALHPKIRTKVLAEAREVWHA